MRTSTENASSDHTPTLGEYEFCGPDYEQLGLWARALKLSLTALLERLTAASRVVGPACVSLQVVDGAIHSAVLDLKALPLQTFEWVPGLQIRQLGIQNGGDSSPKTFSGRLPALTTLSCYRNQLTEFDLSGLPALDWLFCSSNQLTELDLRKQEQLWIFRCDTYVKVRGHARFKQN